MPTGTTRRVPPIQANGHGAPASAKAAVPAQAGAALSLLLMPEVLRPLIEQVVTEVLRRMEAERARLDNGRLAYSEPEAAALLGLEPHQLRDERRRGRIGASSIVGRRVRYTREDLVRYLAERRVDGSNEG